MDFPMLLKYRFWQAKKIFGCKSDRGSVETGKRGKPLNGVSQIGKAETANTAGFDESRYTGRTRTLAAISRLRLIWRPPTLTVTMPAEGWFSSTVPFAPTIKPPSRR